eukprot:TRINITY_DN211_c0_g1_i3.p1 TRINITY_DN211_c0_g1~~TRINITY_DN211_c0_g1_i3.p1  ORF type:complete len:494 (-),score=190.28 TRINITY_DN211_c0_g1_i3:693-2174(-)
MEEPCVIVVTNKDFPEDLRMFITKSLYRLGAQLIGQPMIQLLLEYLDDNMEDLLRGDVDDDDDEESEDDDDDGLAISSSTKKSSSSSSSSSDEVEVEIQEEKLTGVDLTKSSLFDIEQMISGVDLSAPGALDELNKYYAWRKMGMDALKNEEEFDIEKVIADEQKALEEEEERKRQEEQADLASLVAVESSSSGQSMTTAARGTEIRLLGLKLAKVGLLELSSFAMVVACNRCNTQEDVEVQPGSRGTMECRNCNALMSLGLRIDYMHEGNNVAGYLDLEGCHVFDALASAYQVSCFACSKKSLIKNFAPGQPLSENCHHCFAKMVLSFDDIVTKKVKNKNSELAQKAAARGMGQKRPKKKNVNNPAIKFGEALPKNGACKHYGRSYRWLRFPCCGKAYACHACHDKEENHPFKFAKTQVCGWCCKSQSFEKENCVACGKSLTGKGGSNGFWEGGKGVRDQKKMSKKEKKKFAGEAKTQSRKSIRVGQKKKKL